MCYLEELTLEGLLENKFILISKFFENQEKKVVINNNQNLS